MGQAITDDPVLKRFKSELVREYGDRLRRVRLYGSRARGDHRDDSDYDVAIFISGLHEWFPESQRVSEIIHSLGEFDYLFSPTLFSPEDFDMRTPLMHEIRGHGIDL